ncbi:MAG: response regulator [Deltaproteobacteria bacterium]|jgi:DNA-binding response OmpR family regulator
MGEKILVVDDERVIRDILHDVLVNEGYEVILASNGEEAVKLAKRENPQAILLDIKMPGVNGIEACKRLKADEKTSSIPVVMISAHGEHKREAIDAGAEDFLTKPFSMVEIFTRVRSILRVGNLSDELKKALEHLEELEKDLPKD